MSNQNLSSISLKFLIIFFLFLSFSITTNAEEKEVDINTNPNGYFFEVDNLKPGDWMPRYITIINDGTRDFKYTAIVGEKKSKKGLLEELELLVEMDSKVLYEGKLIEFEGFNPRNLATGTSETMLFQVTMPYDLGNEFQKSSAEVEILFIAELVETPGGGNPPEDSESPGGNTPSDGDFPEKVSDHNSSSEEGITVTPEIRENILPNSATNTYNIIFIGVFLLGAGSLLVFFHNRRMRRDL
ncbi:TasA family protein [Niallia sp. Krafla_26]|uniref:TasA family protein n=1 Tax=Niallia sp. Krafla_26 TaxID=3064703 RepID=UPI003D1822D0